MRPKVSIVVPIYNTIKYLQRCLESLVDQTLDDIEIILVNDGSTDNSGALCDDYARRYNNIKVIHKKNEGVGIARNKGIDIATGEYIAFVDSDDFVDKDMYENLYDTAKVLNIETVLCGYKRYYNTDVVAKKSKCSKVLYQGTKVYENAVLELVGTIPEALSDVSICKSVCMGIYSLDLIKRKKIRFYSEKKYIFEDMLFNITYFKYTNGLYVDEATSYNFCVNSMAISSKYDESSFDEYIFLYKKLRRVLRRHKCQKEIKMRLQRTSIAYARFLIDVICTNYELKDAIIRIKKLCDNDNLSSVFEEYEYKKCPINMKVMCFFMNTNQAFLIWFVIKIKRFYCLVKKRYKS